MNVQAKKIEMKITIALLIAIALQSCQPADKAPKLDVDKIKIELDSIMVLDQKHRSELSDLYKNYGFESNEFQSVFKKQRRIDSLNLIYVEDLISKHGKYPGKSLLGNSIGEVAFFVLQHAPDSIQAKYIDIILEASKNNELKKGSVAMFHDRYLTNKGEPQIYGTQIGTKEIIDSVTGEIRIVNYCFPIKDTVSIDSLRLWNGLLDLEGYLNSFGLSRWSELPADNK